MSASLVGSEMCIRDRFCYKPDALYITRVFFIAQPPEAVLEGCHVADLVPAPGRANADDPIKSSVCFDADQIF
eukprot:12309679-Alexandrium_andersonii.AAC.1